MALPWLKHGFSFLSGFPEEVRRSRIIVPVQVFADESSDSTSFVMAALGADAEDWLKFSDEWKFVLKQSPSIGLFKMKEAASCTGEFYGFSEAARDNKLRELAGVINRHVKFCIYVVLDLDAYAKHWAPTLRKPQNDPYFFPFQMITIGVALDLYDLGWRERFEMIFDEQKISGLRAKVWYPILLRFMRKNNPEQEKIMPVDIIFKSDDDFMPLQAADLYAWCYRKGGIKPQNPEDHPFHWLLQHLSNVSLSKASSLIDENRIAAIKKAASKTEGSYSAEEIDFIREVLGRK